MSATYTVPAGVTGTFDLAQVRCPAAGALTIQMGTGPAASTDTDQIGSSMMYTVAIAETTLASTDLYAHEHLIEGTDLAPLQNQTMSLGFSVYVNTAGTYSVYLANGARNQSYVANFTIASAQVNTWVRIKIQGIPPLPATGWTYSEGVTGMYIGVVMAVGTQRQTTSPNVWNTAMYCGTSSNMNMMATGNNQLWVTGFKLEGSTGCTYMAVNSFEGDFFECIRYYWSSFNYQSLTAGMPLVGTSPTAGNFLLTFGFPRRMCKVPTVTPYGYTSHTAGNITDINSATDIATPTLPAVIKGISATGAAAGTKAYDPVGCFVIADARLT
jgi:hypothetical protein